MEYQYIIEIVILIQVYRKRYFRANYIESNIEEDIDLKNQYYIKNLPTPINLDDCISQRDLETQII